MCPIHACLYLLEKDKNAQFLLILRHTMNTTPASATNDAIAKAEMAPNEMLPSESNSAPARKFSFVLGAAAFGMTGTGATTVFFTGCVTTGFVTAGTIGCCAGCGAEVDAGLLADIL